MTVDDEHTAEHRDEMKTCSERLTVARIALITRHNITELRQRSVAIQRRHVNAGLHSIGRTCHEPAAKLSQTGFQGGAENARLENARTDWLWKADQA